MADGWNDGRTSDDTLVERFLDGKPTGPDVCASILDSWRRCRAAGLTPDSAQAYPVEDLDPECDLVRAARPVFERLRITIADTPACVFLGDARSVIFLRAEGDPVLGRALDAVGAAPGFRCAETDVGTTAFNSVLVERRARQVSGHEHFAEALRWSTAAAAPVRDPLSGRLAGAISVTCPNDRANAEMMELARRSAAGVEQRLLDMATDRERALIAAFLREQGAGAARPAPGTGPRDLPSRDRLTLQEAAVNLVAQGRAAVVDVALSDGRVATLVARPVTGSAGAAGIAVQAWIPGRSRPPE
ncbi:transcriptional regulator of acetoin/glycerol metabolism [Thermocatellispora tengchongensis]|uniref:Transcriptional regulator of acetoin/glycerol metabolism n=1 Tax=Thermocatellispora tengchongensis TaxID=1073253 RepID=A0A840PNT6_9ACTN|nr:GAF domain-containing protein [Thermocatellispora tengchongensis]MBB5139370.1 transcriptional regulator of acetoin/glycerol metabolism [Thermocatellispora tengchongensis]